MTDYTPTTEQIRDVALLGAMDAAGGEHNLDAPAFLAMFDRWLVGVKADTWAEGWAKAGLWEIAPPGTPYPWNPYRMIERVEND